MPEDTQPPARPAEGTPYNRYEDALFAQSGACNPVALCNSLVRHLKAAWDEGGGTDGARQDPACRLIAHQLAHLMGHFEVENGAYGDLMKYCADRSRISVVKVSAQYLLPKETADANQV